jgi:hypothetical protein
VPMTVESKIPIHGIEDLAPVFGESYISYLDVEIRLIQQKCFE